jgi:hypothetical protein
MNLFNRTSWQKLAALLLATTLLALSGCANIPNASGSSSQKLVAHAFSYNGRYDDPKWANQVDLLEYSYGDKYHMVRDAVKYGKESVPYSSGVNGSMPVGEFLYVKWRIKATGEEFEDKVDLRNRLPDNMFSHTITFVIDGKQLYVYLVTPQGKKTDAPPILKTTQSRYYVTYEIYPNNTYKK